MANMGEGNNDASRKNDGYIDDVGGVVEVTLYLTVWYSIHLFIFQGTYEVVVDSFDKMNLKDELLHGIYNYGFEKPSVIQQRAIPPCLESL